MRELNEQELVRRNKVEKMREYCNPYPTRYEITHSLVEAVDLADEVKDVSVAGRIVFMRQMGKLSFIKIRDVEGELQASIKVDIVGEEKYNFFKDFFDIGDYIGIKGEMFTTNTGEKTIRADEFIFLGKALKPLPEKFHGLSDAEQRYRHRYVDLIMNEDTRKRFVSRIKFVRELRNFLDGHGYYEIETPILNNQASGAVARPFKTHHNALDLDVYLRIAPETYLKRAVAGGFNRVYEIARCFRNEGMDASHLQDFTMIEAYHSYFNFEDNMIFIQELIQTIVQKVFGTLKFTIGDQEVDLSGNWPKVSFRELLLEHADIDINVYDTQEKLLKIILEKKIELDSDTPVENLGYGNLIDYLYKKVARPKMVGPVYLTEHPTSLSPFARENDENPEITERFQLVLMGAELVNGFSELVNPIEQERRLIEQAKLKEAGDEEAHPMDSDYVGAMEYGLPPISGWGMGIDRVIQLLTNSDNIKDVVMFPLMRPINEDE